MQSGIKYEEAYPVPNYILINYKLPESSYRAAVDIFADVPASDAAAHILRAEAIDLGGDSDNLIKPILEASLAKSPALARGWMLYAQKMVPEDSQRAVAAMNLVSLLAPFEFWLAAPFSRTAAPLFDTLPANVRRHAEFTAASLWFEVDLNNDLRALLRIMGGPELMTHALSNQPEQIRELNRWARMKHREDVRENALRAAEKRG